MVTQRKKRRMIQFIDRENTKIKATNRKDPAVGLCTMEFETVGDMLRVIIKRKRPLRSGRIMYESLSMDLGVEDWNKLDAWIHFNLERAVEKEAA